MKLNIELIQKYLQAQKNIHKFARQIFAKWSDIFDEPKRKYDGFNIEGDSLIIDWYELWTYGGSDSGNFTIPLNRLDDWESYLVEQHKEEQKNRRLIEIEQIEKQEQKDRNEWIRLKEKYENKQELV